MTIQETVAELTRPELIDIVTELNKIKALGIARVSKKDTQALRSICLKYEQSVKGFLELSKVLAEKVAEEKIEEPAVEEIPAEETKVEVSEADDKSGNEAVDNLGDDDNKQAQALSKKGCGSKKEGVITTIIGIMDKMLETGDVFTREIVHAALVIKFPDRDPVSLRSTVNTQICSHMIKERGMAFEKLGKVDGQTLLRRIR